MSKGNRGNIGLRGMGRDIAEKGEGDLARRIRGMENPRNGERSVLI